jgi:hypothetical protein
MIPLWISASLPVQSAWGWAFRSFGAPWVAHRVWAMPGWPAGVEPFRCSVRLLSLPARFSTKTVPFSVRTAMPAES